MGRFNGFSGLKGDLTASALKTSTFDAATGISTDANNNVTAVTLGSVSYSSITYDADGFITQFTETINGVPSTYQLTYNSDDKVTAITQV